MPGVPSAKLLESRLRDPVFARAYESWLEILVERAERVRPREHRIVIRGPETADRPNTLAG